MPHTKITPLIVAAMKKMVKKSFSLRQIATFFLISSGTVSYWVRKRGTQTERSYTSPRSRAARSRRKLVKKSVAGSVHSANDIRCQLKNIHGILVSKQTVIRDLHQLGFQSRVRPKTCCLAADYVARLAFAKMHVNDDPKTLCFSDEKLFTSNDESMRLQWLLDGSTPTPRQSTRWPAGRVMVWACIGVGFRHIVLFPQDSKIDSALYIRLCLSPIRMHLKNHMFTQDNAPCHASNRTANYLANQHINTMQWTPRSPDMNVIEILWAVMQRRVGILAPTDRPTLIAAIKKVWSELQQSTIDALILGWNDRLQRVISNNGRM